MFGATEILMIRETITTTYFFILFIDNLIKLQKNSFNSDASIKKVHFNVPFDNSLTSDNIIFEELENENDNEDFLSEAFSVLPFTSLAFNAFEDKKPYCVCNNSHQAIKPIFIS